MGTKKLGWLEKQYRKITQAWKQDELKMFLSGSPTALKKPKKLGLNAGIFIVPHYQCIILSDFLLEYNGRKCWIIEEKKGYSRVRLFTSDVNDYVEELPSLEKSIKPKNKIITGKSMKPYEDGQLITEVFENGMAVTYFMRNDEIHDLPDEDPFLSAKLIMLDFSKPLKK